ncbi:hydantoinase [Chromatiales bacterium (ex Bugula neritina AB1)]|nr:hydantoinase [Chromatiales bacterium (ex Bugula neritina AB1)]
MVTTQQQPDKTCQTTNQVIAGIDVGGTFTDLLVFDSRGSILFGKTPTTIDNQAFGVMQALSNSGVSITSLDTIVHGTTTTTNAVLERKLARTGMITTRGFRDIIELGRRTRPQPYGMHGQFQPVIPRELRLEITQRTDASGDTLIDLDEDECRAAINSLLQMGCEALVIHFLHAYANPEHEQRAAAIAKELWPNNYITTGHSLLSEYREYERGVTASINASVQPILDNYIDRLQGELKKAGYHRELLVMNGNGGMVSAALVARESAKTVMSGPASGVMAAAYTAKRAGIENIITYDMGGTSSDVALILNAVPSVSHELEIEYAMPIHVPMVDVRTIGSGGGSIASINDAGLLQVGPQSAGATPGPICYGRGGTEPTISDANLALGRLNDKALFSVDGTISSETIKAAIDAKIASPLNLSVDEAAGAILTVANNKMAGAVRMVSISRGHDPRDFALFAFGGAGPLHAVAIARELGIPKVLVPARPGITNALGCVVADVRHDFVNTVNRPLDTINDNLITQVFSAQCERGEKLIAEESITIDNLQFIHTADMQFIGQTHLLSVPISSRSISCDDLQQRFEAVYLNRFHVELSEIRANLVNLNTTVIGSRPEVDLSRLIDPHTRKPTLDQAQLTSRPVWFDGNWHDTPIYQRELLPIDAVINGPAIVEQSDTTVVIEPDCTARGDADGNLLIEIS